MKSIQRVFLVCFLSIICTLFSLTLTLITTRSNTQISQINSNIVPKAADITTDSSFNLSCSITNVPSILNLNISQQIINTSYLFQFPPSPYFGPNMPSKLTNCSAFIQTSENVSGLPTYASVNYNQEGVFYIDNSDVNLPLIQTLGETYNGQPLLINLDAYWISIENNFPPTLLFNLNSSSSNISKNFYLNYTIQLHINYTTTQSPFAIFGTYYPFWFYLMILAFAIMAIVIVRKKIIKQRIRSKKNG